MKILFIFGTRPEAIKLAPLIKRLGKDPENFKVVLCNTAQHSQMLNYILQFFEINAHYNLCIMKENQSLFDITSRGIHALEGVLKHEKPDLVVVQGDTTTTLVGSLAAFYLRIPLAYVESGLRTYDKYNPFPEEINRKLISSIVDLHFAPTEKAKENLLKEGVSENNIFVTGNTVIDALLMTLEKSKIQNPDFLKLNCKWPILVTAHRRESFGKALEEICYALKEIVSSNKDVEIFYPVHMNPNVITPVTKILAGAKKIHLLKPLNYDEFVWLMSKSYLILTDSGGILEEAPSLKKPVLVLRSKTERPEAIIAGTAKLIGTEKKKIVSEVLKLLYHEEEYKKMIKATNPYGNGRASERIESILEKWGSSRS